MKAWMQLVSYENCYEKVWWHLIWNYWIIHDMQVHICFFALEQSYSSGDLPSFPTGEKITIWLCSFTCMSHPYLKISFESRRKPHQCPDDFIKSQNTAARRPTPFVSPLFWVPKSWKCIHLFTKWTFHFTVPHKWPQILEQVHHLKTTEYVQ